MGVSNIARAAGVYVRTVHDILRRRQRRVHAEKADRILAVGASQSRLVDGAETWRRVRELRDVGLTERDLAHLVSGYRPRRSTSGWWQRDSLSLNRHGRIHRRNAEAIERFYVHYFHVVLRRATPEEQRTEVPRDAEKLRRDRDAHRLRRRRHREAAA